MGPNWTHWPADTKPVGATLTAPLLKELSMSVVTLPPANFHRHTNTHRAEHWRTAVIVNDSQYKRLLTGGGEKHINSNSTPKTHLSSECVRVCWCLWVFLSLKVRNKHTEIKCGDKVRTRDNKQRQTRMKVKACSRAEVLAPTHTTTTHRPVCEFDCLSKQCLKERGALQLLTTHTNDLRTEAGLCPVLLRPTDYLQRDQRYTK